MDLCIAAFSSPTIYFLFQLVVQAKPAKSSKLAGGIRKVSRPTQTLEVHYRDLSGCQKPQYLQEYKAHCWGVCKHGMSCSNPPDVEDISNKR